MRTTALAWLLFSGMWLDAAPFRMNGWQLHEYHLPKLEEAILIDQFVLEMRWRLANRRRALEEDARILEVTARMMEVEGN